jgi:hypothetical protein
MARIIRLTEQDLARIVRRVINEDDKKATTCSQLDGKISDVVLGMTEKNKNLDIKKGGVGVTIHGSNWKEKVINEDPYSYVKLYNGKYCVKHQSKNNWTEVTDSNQIRSVEKSLNSEIDYMSVYRKHEKKN